MLGESRGPRRDLRFPQLLPHPPASLNFTMSPLIFTMPFQLPRSDFAVTETGTILAIGRPCLVITNEFPLATWSSNPRHFDLNSLIPKVDSFTPLVWV